MGFNPKVSLFSGETNNIDHTPAGAVSAGDVVVVNGVAYFAQSDIAAAVLGSLVFSGGVWKGNQAAVTIVRGDRIYWNPTGTPVTGTAASGAFTNVAAAGNIFVGYAVAAAASTDSYVYFVRAQGAEGYQAAGAVAATGSVQGDAAALYVGFNHVTGADATKGVILPGGNGAKQVRVKNSDAANAILKVYPPTGGTVNALTGNAAISLAAKVGAIFETIDGLAWYTIPLLPS